MNYGYLGAIHIHTDFSDGTGDIRSITEAAKKAGLYWIIVTDHNVMNIEEGIINGITVIRGEEISPAHNNHYLAFGIDEKIEPTDNPQVYVDEVRRQGGFGIVAHPDESAERKNFAKPIKWLDKNIEPDGVEVWNWFSQWADNYNEKNVLGVLYAFFFKNNLVTVPYRTTVRWWDELNNKSDKILPAIGGLDVHALNVKKYIFNVTIFSYEFLFTTIANKIFLREKLSDNFEIRKKQILNAIKNANSIIVNRKVSDKIPDFMIKNGTSVAIVGESIKLDESTLLYIDAKQNSDIKIFKDGDEVYSAYSKHIEYKIQNIGKYRVEIMLKNKGFCYTNPIEVV